MKVRMATVNDIDLLIKVRFDYFDADNWELTVDKKNMIYSQLQQYYPEHLNKDFFAALVEDANEDIVSAAFLIISEKPANLYFPTGKTGTILNVLTYPEYRKMGYATKALNSLIDEAKNQNLSYIELSASELGKPLYQKLGFLKFEESHHEKMKLALI
ncbi:acetyltransferase (GNAT) family protein [Oxobacter pfennigii]|uniref:Acetyltransferase (GNAT) family protein n=2 Tax=Oxobacter pfennigii TaxID=36849 RepID=A0A0P8YF69_9CLOT|nr:acetyltransferase (GNAT) family protein [Oxobacter pfennigii]